MGGGWRLEGVEPDGGDRCLFDVSSPYYYL